MVIMRGMAKLFVLGILALLFIAGQGAWALDKETLDLLLKKGVITQREYDEIMKGHEEASKGPVTREPLKGTTPVTSTETGPGPHPVGTYKDLERIPGGIENLRKEGYRNVFTTIDNVLKHSERLSVGIVAMKVQDVADNSGRKPGST